MKAKQVYLMILLISVSAARAQDCKVSVDALAGVYVGECRNGKADGVGKATGTDIYEGQFKNGMPNGTGKYLWKNGNSYEGEFVKGVQDGNGIMIYRLPFKDSVVKGYWKKGTYAGKYVKPYLVYTRTVHVTGIAFKPVDSKFNQIELFLDSETGNQSVSFNQEVPKPQLTNIQLVHGRYEKMVTHNQFGKKVGYILEEVEYPFRAIFTIGNDTVEFEIFEGSKWVVDFRLAY